MLTGTEPPVRGVRVHQHVRRRSRRRRIPAVTGGVLVFALLVAGLAASASHFIAVDLGQPAGTPRFGAAAVTTVLCGLLAHRVGGHTIAACGFAAFVSAGAVVAGWGWLLAGVAALTAFAAAVLAVLATVPARQPRRVLREYAVAVVVALAGAVAVAAYGAPVDPAMLERVVLLCSLLATLWVAHRLGGGFAGAGSRGALVVLLAVATLVAGLAYGEAVRRWGSPGLMHSVEAARQATTAVLGAVPRPVEVLLGFPALVWGLATRSRLRQGWWVCAFGSLGTAGVTTSLATSSAASGMATEPAQALLSTLYSVLLGLVVGLVVWRVDRLLTGPRGRRARGAERALPPRPEPSRGRPLL
ncbi:MAG: hypothetical protein M3165_01130 [Actinomycetota bacterium]|nr:hypothetical protein [Actinomycetota bacterium]